MLKIGSTVAYAPSMRSNKPVNGVVVRIGEPETGASGADTTKVTVALPNGTHRDIRAHYLVETWPDWAMISSETGKILIDQWYEDRSLLHEGKWLIPERDGPYPFTAVDNSSSWFWAEDFTDAYAAIQWLTGEDR